jgi:NAD-dependent deacetylase
MDSSSTNISQQMQQSLEEAVRAILASKRCIVFTGAGMSADSGIDTFRSARGGNGFWSGLMGKAALLYGGTPLGWKVSPAYVWSQFIPMFLEPIYKAQPHEGYYALAELQRLCYRDHHSLFHVITMNVDGFHQQSGIDPFSVSEVHGTVRRFQCISCAKAIEIENPLETVSNPPRCVCGGYPRPAVTLFFEGLPQGEWGQAVRAIRKLEPKDVVLVIGTSSVVYPAADLPEMGKNRGATVIEVNPDENTPLSSIVDIKLVGGAKDMLTALIAMIKEEQQVATRSAGASSET